MCRSISAPIGIGTFDLRLTHHATLYSLRVTRPTVVAGSHVGCCKFAALYIHMHKAWSSEFLQRVLSCSIASLRFFFDASQLACREVGVLVLGCCLEWAAYVAKEKAVVLLSPELSRLLMFEPEKARFPQPSNAKGPLWVHRDL